MDVSQAGIPSSIVLNFPTDIMAYVFWFVPGEQIGRLKLTGAKSVWSRLRYSVKSTRLGDDFLLFKSWPAFLNDLCYLESLSIENSSIPWWLSLGFRWNLLPSTLKYLKLGLHIGAAYQNFFEDEKGNKLHLEQVLPHLETLDIQVGVMTDLSWVNHVPPTLTNLTVPDWGRHSQTKEEHFGELPATLIRFMAVKLVRKSGIGFPPSLETLCVDTFTDASILPPSLTSLKADVFPLVRTQPEQLILLPRTLTNLEVHHLPSASWRYLPPNLVSLHFCLSVDDLGLKVVSDPKNRCMVTLGILKLEHFPNSITHLHAFSDGALIAASEDSELPPKLQTLDSNKLILLPPVAQRLPSTLTHFETSWLSEENAANLPLGLRTLIARDTITSPNLMRLLPKSITKLELTKNYTNWVGHFDDKRNVAPDLAELPNSSSLCEWPLPPNLTSLLLVDFEELGDSFLQSQKLENLLELNLKGATHFSDLSISLLNRHITHLNLSHSSELSGQCFPHLPRSLLYLNFDASPNILDDHVPHLPKSLKEVFFTSAIHLTDLCASQFPRHLERLMLGKNEAITRSCVPNLPSPIKSVSRTGSFRVSTFSITSGQIVEFQTPRR